MKSKAEILQEINAVKSSLKELNNHTPSPETEAAIVNAKATLRTLGALMQAKPEQKASEQEQAECVAWIESHIIPDSGVESPISSKYVSKDKDILTYELTYYQGSALYSAKVRLKYSDNAQLHRVWLEPSCKVVSECA